MHCAMLQHEWDLGEVIIALHAAQSEQYSTYITRCTIANPFSLNGILKKYLST